MAKKDIILSGVGGQGILSIATVIGWAALDQNLHLKQAEVHGMSQRGGDVQSNLRISTERIWSDLIPKGECDLILSLEPGGPPLPALALKGRLDSDKLHPVCEYSELPSCRGNHRRASGNRQCHNIGL